MARGSPNRRDVVKERVSEPHQLSGAVSSLPSTPVLHKAEAQHHRTVEDGQPDSGDLHKQNGGSPLTGPMHPSYFTVGLESATEHVPGCRIPSWEGEHSGRPGIKGNEGQMRLDAEFPCVQSDPIPDGSMRDRPL